MLGCFVLTVCVFVCVCSQAAMASAAVAESSPAVVAPPPFTPTALAKAKQTRSASEQLVATLAAAADDGARFAALDALREAADDAYGADAAALAAAVRDGGGIEALMSCLRSSSVDAQQCAMALLGNLLTDEFDHEARQSLKMFAAAGGLGSLQSKLSAEQPICLFACATLQNVTSLDPIGCCSALRE